jgi:hypothetical protein
MIEILIIRDAGNGAEERLAELAEERAKKADQRGAKEAADENGFKISRLCANESEAARNGFKISKNKRKRPEIGRKSCLRSGPQSKI